MNGDSRWHVVRRSFGILTGGRGSHIMGTKVGSFVVAFEQFERENVEGHWN